ncbi:MAG: ADP-forming succinate--CoA ligase subunit beta [Methanocellales archaeon]
MRMHEYQAKQVFASYKIPIPRGEVAQLPEEAREIARRINKPIAIKAQVHVGGRGKAGGIAFAGTPEEAEFQARRILGMKIKGLTVEKVLVEEKLDIAEEYYLGFTIDRSKRLPVAIVSSMGGVDIEEIAAKTPEKIAKMHIDPLWGFHDYQARELIAKAGISRGVANRAAAVLKTLYQIFEEKDASLVEINPLAVTKQGEVVASDAKMLIDDSALYRQLDLLKFKEASEDNPLERKASELGLNYVKLDGNIGVLGNGAGLVMATLDLIHQEGGRPANFLDLRGGASADMVRKGLEIVLADPDVKVVLFNILGGITRCDEVAKGIVSVLSSMEVKVPIVIRLSGTNEREGREILKQVKVITAETMEECAKKAVAIAEGE